LRLLFLALAPVLSMSHSTGRHKDRVKPDPEALRRLTLMFHYCVDLKAPDLVKLAMWGVHKMTWIGMPLSYSRLLSFKASSPSFSPLEMNLHSAQRVAGAVQRMCETMAHTRAWRTW
jgi:hypothetical protein